MHKKNLPLLALLSLSHQLLGADLPSAGSQLQQIPPAPMLQKAAPELRIDPIEPPPATAADAARVSVHALRISGAVLLPESDLLAASGFIPDQQLSLTELRTMAAKISDRYHQAGYFLAQAYLPAQEIEGGTVTIAIVEGRYGEVRLRLESGLTLRSATPVLQPLQVGDPVAAAPLERVLLLLSDLPGVVVHSSLAPGAAVGTADLVVDIAATQKVTGSIDADNEGNRYTGKNRIGASVAVNNPTGNGDVLALRTLTGGSDLIDGRVSYQTQFGAARAGIAYSRLHYALGEEFSALQASGTAQVATLYGSYPLIRSRRRNLYAQVSLDQQRFSDRIDSSGVVTDKQVHSVTSSLNGDDRDTIGAGGLTTVSLNWTHGDLDIQSAAAAAADAAAARSAGRFDKLGLSVNRQQGLNDTTSLSLAASGQLASHNLDISQKMALGGAFGVRAYPEGEAHGDSGYLLNLEARNLLPPFLPMLPGQLQAIGFVDTGTVTLNKSAWTAGQNRRSLSGLGLGLNWIDGNRFIVKLYLARKLGAEKASSAPDAPYRLWAQAISFF